MAKPEKVTFLSGVEWPAVLVVLIFAGSAAYVLNTWTIYKHPKTEVSSQKNLSTINSVARNMVKTTRTTTPDGTITEEVIKDLTHEDTKTVEAMTSLSLSTPIFAPEAVFGVQAYRDMVGAGWLFGVTVKPLPFIEAGVMTNEGFNRLLIGGKIPLK